MKRSTTSLGFLTAFFALVLFLGAGCNSDGTILGFSGASGVIGAGDDVDGDGVPDSVFIDGSEIPVIPPTSDPGCLDLNSDGECGLDEPPIFPPDDPDDPPVIIPTPVGCEDPDNDGICGTTDLQPNSGILLRVISSNDNDASQGVSSAEGSLVFNNGVSTFTILEPNRFDNTPQTFCFLINAREGSNEFLGMTLKGSPGDRLTLEVYKGPDGSDLVAACKNDPASVGTLECSGTLLRESGTPPELNVPCDL